METVRIELTKVSIDVDGHNRASTYFVDAIHDNGHKPRSTSISCGTTYELELLVARDYAARLGAPLVDCARQQVSA